MSVFITKFEAGEYVLSNGYRTKSREEANRIMKSPIEPEFNTDIIDDVIDIEPKKRGRKKKVK